VGDWRLVKLSRSIGALFRVPLGLTLLAFPGAAQGNRPGPPAEAMDALRRLYDGDVDTALEKARAVQRGQPEQPLGYLLEANALWWRLYCEACEVKWNTVDAWRRGKEPGDDAYLALADRGIALAEAKLAQSPSAEMRVFAGLGYALKARLHGLRGEHRPTARTGVRAREHFNEALRLDPQMLDAKTGLGLYNYYVDTLSTLARVLRFFLGIPGGSKREGMKQLEEAMHGGQLTRVEARFYLARNLRNYDRDYARADELMRPLVDQHPSNPLFHLIHGDLLAKLARHEQAAASYRRASELAPGDSACAMRLRRVAASAQAALPQPKEKRR